MKPEKHEYAPYYETYISLTENRALKEQLIESRNKTLTLIEGIAEEQFSYAYQEGKWTVKELLQHIIDTEIVFAYRAFAIARGEKQHLPGFDQDEYVEMASKTTLSKQELISAYKSTRAFTLSVFDYLKVDNLTQTGTASGNNLSVRAAGFIILGHEKHHLNILSERYLNG